MGDIMKVTDIKEISELNDKVKILENKKNIINISVALASGLAWKDKITSFYEVIARELLEIFNENLLEDIGLNEFNQNYIKIQIEDRTIYFNKNNLFLKTYKQINIEEWLSQDLIILENKNLPQYITSIDKEDMSIYLTEEEMNFINENYSKQELNSNKFRLQYNKENEIKLINILTKGNYFSISIYEYIKSIATGKYKCGTESNDKKITYFKSTFDSYILELGLYISNTIEKYLK